MRLHLLYDLRLSVRSLRKSPGFAAVAVLTFALGIGLNSVIFSMINPFVIRPLPVPAAAQLVVVGQQDEQLSFPVEVDYQDYLALRDGDDAFASLTAHITYAADLSGDGPAERIWVQETSANLFETLGLRAAIGRTFVTGDDAAPQSRPLLVLTDAFWRRRFAADPAVIGRTLRFNGSPVTIAGVLPPGFIGLRSGMRMDAFVPLNQVAPGWGRAISERGAASVEVLGRLRDGHSLAQAKQQAAVIGQRLGATFPQTNRGRSFVLVPETRARPALAVAATTQRAAGIFLGLVGMVLLIACVNVANLMLAKATTRQRDLALRAALGAGRLRLVRQALAESLLLAALGGGGAILLASWAASALGRLHVAIDAPLAFAVPIDWRVFAFTLAATLGAGLIAALLPALQVARTSPAEAMRHGQRSVLSGAGGRTRAFLVSAQVATSVVVLISALLVQRSVRGAARLDLGFQPDHVLLLSVDPSNRGYSFAQSTQFFNELLRKARATPGVQAAAVGRNIPFGYSNSNANVYADGAPVTPESRRLIFYSTVSGSFFQTLRLPLREGRDFSAGDDSTAARVAIVNQRMATLLWPGNSALGRRFRASVSGPLYEVVGVAGDWKYNWLKETAQPFFFLPAAQNGLGYAILYVRTTGDPLALAPALRAIISGLDPGLPVFDVRSMEQHLRDGRALGLLRLGGLFAALFGSLALAIASIGVYGVVSFATSRRTREIALRMALGAAAGDIRQLVVRQTLLMCGAGIGAGGLLTLLFARLLSTLLFGVGPADPLSYGSVCALLLAIALLASWLPARRAQRVQPVTALQEE